MKKKEVLDKFDPYRYNAIFSSFVNWLYKKGNIILSPEEVKGVDAMTTLAETHGMNPFNPKHTKRNKKGGDKE